MGRTSKKYIRFYCRYVFEHGDDVIIRTRGAHSTKEGREEVLNRLKVHASCEDLLKMSKEELQYMQDLLTTETCFESRMYYNDELRGRIKRDSLKKILFSYEVVKKIKSASNIEKKMVISAADIPFQVVFKGDQGDKYYLLPLIEGLEEA